MKNACKLKFWYSNYALNNIQIHICCVQSKCPIITPVPHLIFLNISLVLFLNNSPTMAQRNSAEAKVYCLAPGRSQFNPKSQQHMVPMHFQERSLSKNSEEIHKHHLCKPLQHPNPTKKKNLPVLLDIYSQENFIVNRNMHSLVLLVKQPIYEH